MTMIASVHSLLLFFALFGLVACIRLPTDTPAFFAPAPGSPIAVAQGAETVAIGDVNNDSKPDLAVAGSNAITVLIGQGDGQFRLLAASPHGLPESPSEMALDDIDNDGNLDLALAIHDNHDVVLLRGDGQGGFVHAPTSPVIMKAGDQPHTHGLVFGDLNGDGKLDLVTANSNPDNNIAVALGDGQGGFTQAPNSPFAVGPSPYPFTLADLNTDGHLDIVATNTATGPDRNQQLAASRSLTLLFGDGTGNFQPTQTPLQTTAPWFVAVGDLNDDAAPDIVATHHEQRALTVLLGDDKGGFTESADSPFDPGYAPWYLALVDVNRDGNADVVGAAGDALPILLGDGQGAFTPAAPLATNGGAWRLAVGDVNVDGKLDLVTSDFERDTVSLFLGQ
jgi:hypothetical protein